MFKLNVPITKSYRGEGNTLVIEGIASDPTIDRDSERFDESAVHKMSETVNKGSIPIRVEHENKFYSEIGIWKFAEMRGDKMYVKGEIDLNLSMARDLEVLLEKGVQIALSVGGRVLDATFEYAKELGRSIKVYKDVLLEEISVVRNPSNRSATLSIAKSYDADKKVETEDALAIDAEAPVEKVTTDEFPSGTHFLTFDKALSAKERDALPDSDFAYAVTDADGKKERKLPIPDKKHVSAAIAAMNGARGGVDIPDDAKDGVWAKIRAKAKKLGMDTEDIKEKSYEQMDAIMTKCCESAVEIPCNSCGEYGCCECEEGLAAEDLETIIMLSRIVQDVGLETVEMPKEFEDMEGWKMIDALPEESFVLNVSGRLMPHHESDFTLNMDWLKYWLSQLLNGNFSWLSPKTFNMALNHLYHHYKQETMKTVKGCGGKKGSGKKFEEGCKKEAELLTVEDLALMEKCYRFKVYKDGNRPQVDGNDLSDVEISKMANAFSILSVRKSSTKSVSSAMRETYSKGSTLSNNTPDMNIKKEEGAVVEAPKAEEVAVTVDAHATEVEPVKADEPNDVEKSAEAGDTDSSINKTSVEGEAAAPVAEEPKTEVAEEAPGVVEQEGEPAPAVVAAEDATPAPAVEAPKAEEVVAPVVEEPKKEEVAEEKITIGKMQEIAQAAIEEAITKTVLPMLTSTLEKAVADINAQLVDSKESLSKSVKTESDRFDSLEKAFNEKLAQITSTVDAFGKTASARKSVSVAQAIEKSFQGADAEEAMTQEAITKAIHEKMDAGMSYSAARTEVMKALQK